MNIRTVISILFFLIPNYMLANTLVADLSTNSININAGFNGAELLLFGAVEGTEDDELIVTVEGPKTDVTVYKKEYVSGIWINRQNATFLDVPSFYYIAVSNPAMKMENFKILVREGIGGSNLDLKIKTENSNPGNFEDWRNSLTRRMLNNGMWVSTTGLQAKPIEIIKSKLFRAPVTLPASVLPGDYKVTVYQLRKGEIRAKEETMMIVKKTGLGASIYNFAHDYSALYGIFAIIMAIIAGYTAALSFRKV